MRSVRAVRVTAATIALVALVFASRAYAFDPFEIQVYDGTSDARGEGGLEAHFNYVAKGLRVSEPPEVPANHQAHLTFEPSYGITDRWEIGGYLQTAYVPGIGLAYAGAKLRSKHILLDHEGFRLGANFELSYVPEKFEADRWGGELRPIAAYEDDAWLFAFNPIVSLAFAGPGSSQGPGFEPALSAYRKIANVVSLGLEYYASFGPIAHPVPRREQLHYLFAVGNLIGFEGWELNVGVGAGLDSASNAIVAKTIVGRAF